MFTNIAGPMYTIIVVEYVTLPTEINTELTPCAFGQIDLSYVCL